MADEEEDPRIEFIKDFVVTTTRMKPEKWLKSITISENRSIIDKFLDDPSIMTFLVLINNSSGNISISLEWPVQISGSRAFYFVKRRGEVLSKYSRLGRDLIYGDLSSPIDQLYAFVDQVLCVCLGASLENLISLLKLLKILFPLMSHKSNWPLVVVKDINRCKF